MLTTTVKHAVILKLELVKTHEQTVQIKKINSR